MSSKKVWFRLVRSLALKNGMDDLPCQTSRSGASRMSFHVICVDVDSAIAVLLRNLDDLLESRMMKM